MAVFFISDLHLSASRPEINRVFFEFLRSPARRAESLYILGDLFEYWAGDDDLGEPFNASVVAALAECSRAGPSLHVMHGNRDFLLGADFAAACNAGLIGDPHNLDLFGTRTLLMHGDTLCTDDADYQAWRRKARSAEFQAEFLAKPLDERHAVVRGLREKSKEVIGAKAADIMDVNEGAVREAFRRHGVTRLVHGHTHRPGVHRLEVDGRRCERWVLPDWYESGGVLACDERGCRTQKS